MPDSRTLWTAVVIICIAVSVFFSVKNAPRLNACSN